MTSYLRSWLYGGTVPAEQTDPVPTLNKVSPPASDDEGGDTETERGADDDDSPPAFPALNSAQRAQSSSTKPSVLSDAMLMPPPPIPSLSVRTPGVPSRPGNSLMVPTTTTKVPPKPNTKRGPKVALAPGFGPLDWAALKSSGADLRGVDTLQRIPPSELKQHNKKDDAWSAFNGKVYNMTPYLAFHPGGEKELMRVAGRDGTKLFASTHAWVNVDFMLDACLVGFLVPEPASP
ncbi:cytochrome b5 [Panaeolus papilionaceus]|nr:cytochrome b5 [Panaeolus papilionaceus]